MLDIVFSEPIDTSRVNVTGVVFVSARGAAVADGVELTGGLISKINNTAISVRFFLSLDPSARLPWRQLLWPELEDRHSVLLLDHLPTYTVCDCQVLLRVTDVFGLQLLDPIFMTVTQGSFVDMAGNALWAIPTGA